MLILMNVMFCLVTKHMYHIVSNKKTFHQAFTKVPSYAFYGSLPLAS